MPVARKNRDNWGLSVIGGGKPLKKGSAYSFDNKYFLLPFNNQLKIYYISTRQCIKSIANINLDKLVDSKIDPLQPNLIWLFKSTGEITVVNWKDRGLNNAIIYQFKSLEGLKSSLNTVVDFRFNYSLNSYEILLLTGKVSHKDNSSSAHKKNITKVIIKLDEKPGNNSNSTGVKVNFNSKNIKGVEVQDLLTVKSVLLYSKSLNSKALVFLTEHGKSKKYPQNQAKQDKGQILELQVIELKSFKVHDQKSFVLKKDTRVTSLAVSNSLLVALGAQSGVVEILYNFVGSTTKVPITNGSSAAAAAAQSVANSTKVLKWHINPVTALNFTKDSSYLLTGGKEKVLVFWQISSDRLQFLPRLNGEIISITTNFLSPDIDSTIANTNSGIDYYSLILNIPNSQNSEIEYLVLNSTELTSRLSISNIKLNTESPLSALHKERRSIKPSADVAEASQKKIRKVHKIEKDYTVNLEVNSFDKNLYLLNGSEIQSYNLIKNEQFFSLNVVPKISIGKVKKEMDLKDPKVSFFKFTCDGKWMVTFDQYETPSVDNLLSQGEMNYNLKFWKSMTNVNDDVNSNIKAGNSNVHWELATKIVDPHGPNIKVVAIIPAPVSYFQGTAFLTVDSKGGVRLWRPQQNKVSYNSNNNNNSNSIAKGPKTLATAWTLKKFLPALTNRNATNICVEWSHDSTLILIGLNNVIYTVPTSEFDQFGYLTLNKQLAKGKSIRALKLINNDANLIILTDHYLVNYNLINDKIVYEYKLDGTTFEFNEKLVAFDDNVNRKFAVAVNYFAENSKGTSVITNALVFLFDFDQGKPVKILKYDYYITAIKSVPGTSNFVVIDNNYNIALLAPLGVLGSSAGFAGAGVADSTVPKMLPATLSSIINPKGDGLVSSSAGADFAEEMVSLVQTTQTLKLNGKLSANGNGVAGAVGTRKDADGDENMADIAEEDADNFWYGKKINNHTFDVVLSRDLEGLDMEDFFNAVVECI